MTPSKIHFFLLAPQILDFLRAQVMILNVPEKSNILIASITPYFLERGYLWFEKNLSKILQAEKTQTWWQDNVLFLEKNQNYPMAQFLRKLDELGYEKVQTIPGNFLTANRPAQPGKVCLKFPLKDKQLSLSPGEFSHRGGIVDVFPINNLAATRIEFLGNQIENIIMLEDIRIENEEEFKKRLKRKLKIQKQFSDLKNLKPGDYLVHLDHGVARFQGMEEAQNQEYYVLEYAKNDKLFVPLGLERKLSRYYGFTKPNVNRLGGALWQNTKKKIKEDVEKFAKELLALYAKREASRRQPYLADDEIQKEIEASFQYIETPDQEKTIEEIKKELELSDKPADRIICGDVGFGKTEIAIRAAVKAAISGRQVAMLSPTTILCHQHFLNFKKRLQKFPIDIAELSRVQSKREQKEIVKKIGDRKIDIIIGTHRLLSNDVHFPNLGMLIIDEEQRFGVKQKEKFKNFKSSIDVLSLSATPIPRSLHLALSGLKSISNIETPPPERLAIKTFVKPFSEKTIRKAIREELSRHGQIYYLHNRVETIGTSKNFIEKLAPEARVCVAHGRMNEKELIKIMEKFSDGAFDILVATTIIENGLDLPNVNTLIVDDATRLGLAEAHQIRGRIGRSHLQAYAYFLHGKHLADQAKSRLQYLKEYQHLGAGYQIAMKDLEMRGAGNILGKEQNGSINQIGLNLYCQMLSETVEKLKTAKLAP